MSHKSEALPLPGVEGVFTDYSVFLPDSSPHGILQICHGMGEYFLRYTPFAEWMAAYGFVVCGADLPGHGVRAREAGTLGVIPGGENLSLAVDLQVAVANRMRRTYRHLPYLLLGHSMGSFIARKTMVEHRDLFDGVLLLGTAGGDKRLPFGITLARLLSHLPGEGPHSSPLYRMAFAHYNDRFGGGSSAWLTRDEEQRALHEADPLSGFAFSAAAMGQMFGCLREVNDPAWFDALPLALPVILLSGEEDPVGGYGKGVLDVYTEMEAREMCSLRYKLYPGARHELLFETNRDEVYADILAFCEEVVDGVRDARTESFAALFGGAR